MALPEEKILKIVDLLASTAVAVPGEQNRPESGLSTMSNLFETGSVMYTCTFNANINMAQGVPEPKKKYCRIIYSSDCSQEIKDVIRSPDIRTFESRSEVRTQLQHPEVRIKY